MLRTRLRSMNELVARTDPSLFATSDLTRFEAKVYSQNGEDGVIIEIMNRIDTTNKYFVEFGIQTGHEGNCVFLADVLGWNGLFIEADSEAYRTLERKYVSTSGITTLQASVTPSNVNDIFRSCGVPPEPDIVSIDIDGNDIWVWAALDEFRPRVVVIEYNSSLDTSLTLCQPYTEGGSWNLTSGFGSALGALDMVAVKKGYALVHTDQAGVNAFYVRKDLSSAVKVDSVPRRQANYRLEGKEHPPGEPEGGWMTFSSTALAG